MHYYHVLEERPLGRPRRRWEDDNKMDLREISWECVDWTHQDRDHWRAFVNTVMNFGVPYKWGIARLA
jgi:hypothetical protein